MNAWNTLQWSKVKGKIKNTNIFKSWRSFVLCFNPWNCLIVSLSLTRAKLCCCTEHGNISILKSWSWSYGSWNYNNYLYNQCLLPPKLWVRIPLRWGVLDTTSYDKVCQWLPVGLWFSPLLRFPSPIKTRHDISEILLKVMLNTTTITPNSYCILTSCVYISC
jgi:hypothetical protein